jgi:glycosyltransferase involved in cell wall biosynthesis
MVAGKDIQKGISVVICCYNSAERLYETLKHLALQKTNDLFPWEIIIVDNASTDNTAVIAERIWKKFERLDVDFKIAAEQQPGLSHARDCGVSAANFEYIIFCDDDNWLNEDYLEAAFKLIETDNSVGAIGGMSTAVSDVELPGWFELYEHAYATGRQSRIPGYINDRGYVTGAGMVTRKAIFTNAVNSAFPSILTDRKGKLLSGGGDVEYCLRLQLQGYNIYYSEELVFKHFIPSFRLTEEYRDGLFQGAADAQWILKEYFEAAKIKRSNKLKLFAAALKDFSKSILKRKTPNNASLKLLYYSFNIGFKNRNDLAVIKHFYNYRNKASKGF